MLKQVICPQCRAALEVNVEVAAVRVNVEVDAARLMAAVRLTVTEDAEASGDVFVSVAGVLQRNGDRALTVRELQRLTGGRFGLIAIGEVLEQLALQGKVDVERSADKRIAPAYRMRAA